MAFLKNALLCIKKRFSEVNLDCLPILVLLYIMLYIMIAYLMLFAALSSASFFAIDFCKCFLFSCFVLVY